FQFRQPQGFLKSRAVNIFHFLVC
ncbi:membrane protein TerC, partial [Helicobacter pylori]